MKMSRLLLSTSVLFSCGLPMLAHAQTADAPAAAAPQADDAAQAKDGGKDDGEIVVTGERANRFGTDTVQSGSFRNARVLDVPMTVAVIPGELLKSQQAIDLLDAVRNTAGVSTTGSNPVAYANLTIRGITVDTRANYRLDGSLVMLSSTSFPLEDKDRVEVLKGASALYYGFSTPAGVVNLTMKRPTEGLTASGDVFTDSNGGYGGHVDVGNTIGKVGFRINAVEAHLDTGIKYSQGDRNAFSGTFDYKPTDRLTMTADLEYFSKNIVEPAQFVLTTPASGPVKIPDISKLDITQNIGGSNWDYNRTSELNLLGKAVYKLTDAWNLTAYVGRSTLERNRFNPQFTPTNLTTSLDPNSATYGAGSVTFSPQKARFDNINYAVEAAGTINLGFTRQELLVGVSEAKRSLASGAVVRTKFTENFINPVFIPDPHVAQQPLPTPSAIDDKGVYIFDRLFLTDYLQLLGGIRKSDYRDDGSINAVTKSPYTASPTSYSAGIVVKPQKWASLYGTYIEGLEETAAAPTTTDNANQNFAPTQSKQYEAGVKLEPKSNLLIQAAYFRIDRGAAYTANLPGTTILHYYTGGRQVYEGGEFSLSGYVTRDLAIYATAEILSAHYRDQPIIAGNRVDGTPDNGWSLAGEYTLPWLNRNLKVNAGLYHTGTQAVNAANQAFTPAYTTVDVGFSYAVDYQDHHLVLRVNAENVGNQHYWAGAGGSALAESLPRVVKFSLSAAF
jgi:iron complex outermembrane receptor protein